MNAPREGLFVYLGTCEEEQDQRSFTDAAGHEVRVSMTLAYDNLAQILHWTSYQPWLVRSTEKTKVTRTPVILTFPQKLEAPLSYNRILDYPADGN
jgi:hypothetical protein